MIELGAIVAERFKALSKGEIVNKNKTYVSSVGKAFRIKVPPRGATEST